MTFTAFLKDIPPGNETAVVQLAKPLEPHKLAVPPLDFFCRRCESVQASFCQSSVELPPDPAGRWRDMTAVYLCGGCQEEVKRYWLRLALMRQKGNESEGKAIKLGEWPVFLPSIPPKLVTLLHGDAELFRKGRLAESVGLGIAAFAYYRRLIEVNKNRILEAVLKVAERRGEHEAAQKIKLAIAEVQFSKAVEDVREAIPQSLRIRGHNPLTLLHSALSEGLHNESDEACLELASAIRTLLIAFAEKAREALKDDSALSSALERLLRAERFKPKDEHLPA